MGQLKLTAAPVGVRLTDVETGAQRENDLSQVTQHYGRDMFSYLFIPGQCRHPELSPGGWAS